jgi:hypothetical protein
MTETNMPTDPIIITPAQCREHNLPPVRIEFSFADEGPMRWVLRGGSVYASFSGAPGGVRSGSISALTAEERGLSLEQLARKRYENGRPPFLLGTENRDTIGPLKGGIVCVEGQSHARTAHFISIVEVSATVSILVTLSASCHVGVPDHKYFTSGFGEFIASLKIRAE